jgi:hypothetical protein
VDAGENVGVPPVILWRQIEDLPRVRGQTRLK